jgi:hypothetical protein
MPVVGRLEDEANTSEVVSTAEHLAKKSAQGCTLGCIRLPNGHPEDLTQVLSTDTSTRTTHRKEFLKYQTPYQNDGDPRWRSP